jgi:hypothetical protein
VASDANDPWDFNEGAQLAVIVFADRRSGLSARAGQFLIIAAMKGEVGHGLCGNTDSGSRWGIGQPSPMW